MSAYQLFLAVFYPTLLQRILSQTGALLFTYTAYYKYILSLVSDQVHLYINLQSS